MRIMYIAALAVLTATFAAGVGRTVVTAQSEKTSWSGVFTAEQAARGKEKATAECSACHGANMAGDLAPGLSGDMFLNNWNNQKLSDLVTKVKTTMPANAPDSLKAEEYADVVAYMLELNGFPAGTEALKIEPLAALETVKITKTK